MGILTNQQTEESFTLHAETVIGRSEQHCNLVLGSRRVSKTHALLRWDREAWWLRDLNSSYGTRVEGQIVPRELRLEPGVSITFGSEEERWVLTSARPPAAVAQVLETGALIEGMGELLVLPEGEPQLTVYHHDERGWVAEQGDTLTEVSDGQILQVGEQAWRLLLPTLKFHTLELDSLRPGLEDLSLTFRVTRDEEHVEISAFAHYLGKRSLGSRAHSYMLLLLARQRLYDAEDPELPPSAHGWVYQDDLMRMLNVDSNRFNVHIHRARHQIAEAGIEGAASIIERRTDTRQLRIGASHLSIQLI